MIKKYRIVMMKYETYLNCEVCTGFWWGNLREIDNLGNPGVDGRIIPRVRWIFRKWDVGLWTG
jgi:hypothetical protein